MSPNITSRVKSFEASNSNTESRSPKCRLTPPGRSRHPNFVYNRGRSSQSLTPRFADGSSDVG